MAKKRPTIIIRPTLKRVKVMLKRNKENFNRCKTDEQIDECSNREQKILRHLRKITTPRDGKP